MLVIKNLNLDPDLVNPDPEHWCISNTTTIKKTDPGLKCSFLERGIYFLANRIHDRHVADYFSFPPLFFIYNFTNVAFDALEEFFKNMALVLYSIQVHVLLPP